jgi:hypothetical protein
MQELNSASGVAANLLTGLGIDEYFTRTASGTISTFLPDALGSPLGLVTANDGPLATSYTYQPFGATTVTGRTRAPGLYLRHRDGNRDVSSHLDQRVARDQFRLSDFPGEEHPGCINGARTWTEINC